MLGAAQLKGTFTALATPFTREAAQVDYASLRRLVEWQLAAGVDGLVACGSTGEAATLSEEEYLEVVARVQEWAGARVPCLAGISLSSTSRAAELAQELEDTHVAGLLVAAPPYNKPPAEGLIGHFRLMHEKSRLPIVAYNIPGRTGVSIAPQVIQRLTEEGVIVGLKEASGSLDQALDILRACGRALALLSGEDSLVLPLMVCGARGVISASANVAPKEFTALTSAALSADWEKARELQLKLVELVRCLFMETNPIVVKAALALQGVIASDAVRLPLVGAQAQTREKLRAVLLRLNLLTEG